MLLTIGLAHFNARDFGDGIPLVGGFQRAREQSRFRYWLRCQLGVDATATQKQKFFHAAIETGADEVGFHHDIVINEISRIGVIGQNAAHACGADNHRIWLMGRHPGFDFALANEVDLLAFGGKNCAIFCHQSFHDGTANHAVMARYIDPLAGQLIH